MIFYFDFNINIYNIYAIAPPRSSKESGAPQPTAQMWKTSVHAMFWSYFDDVVECSRLNFVSFYSVYILVWSFNANFIRMHCRIGKPDELMKRITDLQLLNRIKPWWQRVWLWGKALSDESRMFGVHILGHNQSSAVKKSSLVIIYPLLFTDNMQSSIVQVSVFC